MPVCRFSKIYCCLYSLIVLGGILVIMAFVLPIIIENALKKEAKNQIIMSPQNFNLWGLIPGQSEVSMRRQYFFYNFTNPKEFLYQNQRPEFIEVGPYIYNEYQNYTNLNYTTNNKTNLEEIQYKFWEYFLESQDNQLNTSDKIVSLNLGSLGVWYQAKNVPKYKMALQVFSNMILGLETELMKVILAQGIQTFVKDQTSFYETVLRPARVSKELSDSLWNDELFGWKNWTTLRPWVEASLNGIYSDASLLLKEHFHLTYSNMYAILYGSLKEWISSTELLAMNWYCKNQSSCNSTYLAALQITQQGVTMNPPPGSNKTQSLMTSNDTMRNYPEMSMFLQTKFLKTPGLNISEYENIQFSAEWGYHLFSHSQEENKWLTDYDILLHVGNLKYIFEQGEIFDQTKNLTDLQGIKERFHLDSLQHAHVFYQYLNYMVEEFACQKPQNGTSGQAFISSVASLEMYKNYQKLNDYLYNEIVSGALFSKIYEKNISCINLMISSGLNETDSENICNRELNNLKDISSVSSLIRLCDNRDRKTMPLRSKLFGLSKIDLMILCESNNENQTSFQFLKKTVDSRIHLFYSCSRNNFSCTKDEIAKKQWGNSTITMSPLPELITLSPKYSPSLTIHSWNPNVFPVPFEFLAVFNHTQNLMTSKNKSISGFDIGASNKLLSFDRLFSQATRFLFTDYEGGDLQRIKDYFLVDDAESLLFYLKYIMIEFGLQGFVQTRTVKELLWGYEDPLISIASKTNPAVGGDPSLNPKISLATNMTYEEALNFPQSVYSGKGDPSKTRVYSSIYGLDYITFKDSEFDGNQTNDIYTNPWKEKVGYEGTDSFCNGPEKNKDSIIQIYMADACYGGPAEYLEDVDHDGLHTLRFATKSNFMQNKTKNPIFDKFYMDKWNMALNATSFKKMPLFVTKFRFLNLDPEPIQQLDVYTNENKTEKMTPSSEYEIHIDVEPYTGGAVSASLNIHTSYEYQNDELFINSKYVFLPLLGIVRPGTWSSKAIDSIYGDLMLAIKLKKIILIAGLASGFVLMVLGIILVIVKWKKDRKQKKNLLLAKGNTETDVEGNKEEGFVTS